MIVIVDYNLGNLGSISNMLKKIGKEAIASSKPKDILSATKIILPGVGSFDNGILNLQKLGLIEVLNEAVIVHKKPILGVCLGMQLMAQSSEEGKESGLSWLPLKVYKLDSMDGFRGTIPIMGWNYVVPTKSNSLIENTESKFYFVHSYHFKSNEYQILQAEVEGYQYCAGFQKDNIFGVQFHPEKSHKFGQSILNNFCSL